jgi:hypothetical protein
LIALAQSAPPLQTTSAESASDRFFCVASLTEENGRYCGDFGGVPTTSPCIDRPGNASRNRVNSPNAPPSRGSDLAPTSTRDKPVPRPSTVEERAAAERADRAAKREAREAESLMKRAVGGKVKKMEMGGMCRGMGAATKGGNFRMG